jgi:hypothetical protein
MSKKTIRITSLHPVVDRAILGKFSFPGPLHYKQPVAVVARSPGRYPAGAIVRMQSARDRPSTKIAQQEFPNSAALVQFT